MGTIIMGTIIATRAAQSPPPPCSPFLRRTTQLTVTATVTFKVTVALTVALGFKKQGEHQGQFPSLEAPKWSL
jgi:hypothetical protein